LVTGRDFSAGRRLEIGKKSADEARRKIAHTETIDRVLLHLCDKWDEQTECGEIRGHSRRHAKHRDFASGSVEKETLGQRHADRSDQLACEPTIERSPHADMNRTALLIPALCGRLTKATIDLATTQTPHDDLKLGARKTTVATKYTRRPRKRTGPGVWRLLVPWYRSGADLQRLLPRLSTYLVTSTSGGHRAISP
jgi:hypothetical protein